MEDQSVVVAAFYKFVRLDVGEKREPLLAYCLEQEIKGTILLAAEGINGTIAGSRLAVDSVLAFLRSDDRLSDLHHQESYTSTMPFSHLKVRLKQEIVTFKAAAADPTIQVGIHVAPEDWNALIADSEVTVIDTRNHFEVEMGSFKGAIDPQLQSFSQFADYTRDHLDPTRHKKIAMFCTGGIRCEKASAFLLNQGFAEVYQLQGGILNYLVQVPVEQSLWQGECFVFDDRVTITHPLPKLGY